MISSFVKQLGGCSRGMGMLPRMYSIRLYSGKASAFKTGPSPQRLPDKEQKEFEDSIKKANTQMAIEDYNERNGNADLEAEDKPAIDDQQQSTPDAAGPMVMKTVPEFEGNVNPKTGEVNGPKQDPTRHGDWSFNGRVTDF